MHQKSVGHWIGKLVFLCFTMVLVLGLAPKGGSGAEAQAVSFTVNTTTDATDANPGDGVCETAAGNGVCTLRAAIQETNALAGADTVILPNGVYTLTIAGVLEDLSEFGDLDITDDLTITGAGQDNTMIDGNELDRVFHIVDSSAIVEMVGVTIQNGDVRLALEDGGGIHNQGMLTLRGSTVRENWAGNDGGGIYNIGTLTLDRSTVSSNSTNADGGGIYSGDILTVNNSTISDNAAQDDGGGIYNRGTLTLDNSTVSGNSSVGIFNSGTLRVTNSTVSNNTGCGIVNSGFFRGRGTLRVINSTVSNNTGCGIGNGGDGTIDNSIISGNSTGDGGGIKNSGMLALYNSTVSNNSARGSGGGGIFSYGPMVVYNSAVSDNHASGNGGGIFSYGPMAVHSSTISGNSADGNGGGTYNPGWLALNNSTVSSNNAKDSGGGIYHGPDSSHTLNLSNVTITNNTADSDGDGIGDGGGIFNQIGLVNFKNTIIAGNHDNSPTTQHRDCWTPRPLDSHGYNLIEDTTGCPIGRDTASNLTGINPSLGPLQDNGGATYTHAPLAGSPVIDTGNPAGCTDHTDTVLSSDQRGFWRTFDGNDDGTAICDMGAYEVGDFPNLTESIYLPLVAGGSRRIVVPITGRAILQAEPNSQQVAEVSGILVVGLFLGALLLGIIVTEKEKNDARKEQMAGPAIEEQNEGSHKPARS